MNPAYVQKGVKKILHFPLLARRERGKFCFFPQPGNQHVNLVRLYYSMFSILLFRSVNTSSCQDCVVSFYSTFAFNKYFNWQTSKLQPAIVLEHVQKHA